MLAEDYSSAKHFTRAYSLQKGINNMCNSVIFDEENNVITLTFEEGRIVKWHRDQWENDPNLVFEMCLAIATHRPEIKPPRELTEQELRELPNLDDVLVY